MGLLASGVVYNGMECGIIFTVEELMMKWKARLRFKACGYRLVRQELDSAGNAVGEPVATPYCPVRFLNLLYLADDEGRSFQIGSDAIDIAAKLPPNTGSGMCIGHGMAFFDEGNGRSFEFHEDMLSSMRWESEPFEIDGDFRPCDLYIDYWTVPDADGGVRYFIACDKIMYRREPLKMNVVDNGYKVLADKIWRTDSPRV